MYRGFRLCALIGMVLAQFVAIAAESILALPRVLLAGSAALRLGFPDGPVKIGNPL